LGNLGTGRDYPIIHYFTANGIRAGQYLSRNKFPRDGLDGASAPEPSAGGDIGIPQILSTGSLTALAWIPSGNVLARLNQQGHNSEVLPTTGIANQGRSLITIAASERSEFALLPEKILGMTEGFLTPYWLTKRNGERWERLPQLPSWPRGTLLIGADDESIALWVRSRQRVYFVPLLR
jgi:hypothetical protein